MLPNLGIKYQKLGKNHVCLGLWGSNFSMDGLILNELSQVITMT